MFTNLWIYIAVLFASGANGILNRHSRNSMEGNICGLVDGNGYSNNINSGQWPFVAAIYRIINDKISYVCGGTIISNQAVITAAHCINGNISNIVVRVGFLNAANFLEPESLFLIPSKVANHNDNLALVVMQSEFQFTRFIRPVCLFHETDKIVGISEGCFVGYGKTESYPIWPKSSRVSILSEEFCLSIEPSYQKHRTNTNFCGGCWSNNNILSQDLGNGLFVLQNNRFHLAGVASMATSTIPAKCGSNIGIFTNAHLLSNWILKELKTKDDFVSRVQIEEESEVYQELLEVLNNRTDAVDAISSEESSEPTFSIYEREQTTYQPLRVPEMVERFRPVNNTVFKPECGIMSTETGLVQGGFKASPGMFPWATVIYTQNPTKAVKYVIGSLISYRHVYTEALLLALADDKLAATFPSAENLKLYFGIDDLNEITEITPYHNASKVIVHPKYLLGLPILANLAIVVLREPVEFSKTIFPVCIWDSPLITTSDLIDRQVVGYGYGGLSKASPTKFKKFAVFQIKSINECPVDFKYILRNVKNRKPYFCAESMTTDTLCVGDSASLYIKEGNAWFLLSAFAFHDISTRTKICNGDKPALMENLVEYSSWIQNIIIST